MPISWQIPNATKIFQAARIKGVPDRGRRQGEPAARGIPRDGPSPAAPARGASVKPRRGLFAAFF